jgi:hypothetical protein
MSLFVSGADTFVSRVQRALQQLDPSAMVYHNRIYLDETVPYTGHGQGHELLRRLVQSGYRVDIAHGNRSVCDPTYKHGGRTGSTVRWNPAQIAMLPTSRGVTQCPSCIALGHELGHADQMIRGVHSAADLYPARSRFGFSMRLELLNIRGYNTGSDRDPHAVTENHLRRELRVPDRTYY